MQERKAGTITIEYVTFIIVIKIVIQLYKTDNIISK